MGRRSHLEGRQFKYVKGGMHVLNFFVATLGVCLLAIGVWVRVDFDEKKYRQVIEPVLHLCQEVDRDFQFSIHVQIDSIAYFLMFLGVAIICIGAVGACGTLRERQTYIGCFIVLLYMVMGILIAAAIQALTNKDSFSACQTNLTAGLEKAVQEYDQVDTQRDFMDRVQTQVMCCGVSKGVLDYTGVETPSSCLKNYSDVTSTDYHSAPCDSAIRSFFSSISSNMITILVVSTCLGLCTVAGIGMSGYLFISLRHAKVL